MSIISEFREFAVKGNMMDMAVGIIIGAAFGKVVTSLVNDILMPPIGLLIGGMDFSALAVTLKGAVMAADGSILKPEVTWNYGKFIQTLIDFLIVAWAIFMLVKVMNRLRRVEEKKTAA